LGVGSSSEGSKEPILRVSTPQILRTNGAISNIENRVNLNTKRCKIKHRIIFTDKMNEPIMFDIAIKVKQLSKGKRPIWINWKIHSFTTATINHIVHPACTYTTRLVQKISTTMP
jgi:hypothetical protein